MKNRPRGEILFSEQGVDVTKAAQHTHNRDATDGSGALAAAGKTSTSFRLNLFRVEWSHLALLNLLHAPCDLRAELVQTPLTQLVALFQQG